MPERKHHYVLVRYKRGSIWIEYVIKSERAEELYKQGILAKAEICGLGECYVPIEPGDHPL